MLIKNVLRKKLLKKFKMLKRIRLRIRKRRMIFENLKYLRIFQLQENQLTLLELQLSLNSINLRTKNKTLIT